MNYILFKHIGRKLKLLVTSVNYFQCEKKITNSTNNTYSMYLHEFLISMIQTRRHTHTLTNTHIIIDRLTVFIYLEFNSLSTYYIVLARKFNC